MSTRLPPSTKPVIGPYEDAPPVCHAYDPRAPQVAAWVGRAIAEAVPGLVVEHVGSTAVPGCDGKGIIDLLVLYPPGALDAAKAALLALGFGPQNSGNPFPEDRPMRTGSVVFDGTRFRLHAHVIRVGAPEAEALRRFRDRLRADPVLLQEYVTEKRAIIGSGVTKTAEYSNAKGEFIGQAIAAEGKPSPFTR